MKIIDRIKKILLSPKPEWEIIKNESLTINEMILKYALFLALIGPAAGFFGFIVVGVPTLFGTFTLPFSFALKYLIFSYMFSIAGIFIVTFIIDMLAPNFGCVKDFTQSMKVVVFAYTASWLGGIFLIVPALSILSTIAGIYSLVLMYWGLETVKSVPKEKMTAYYIITLVVSIVVFILIGLLTNEIVFSGFNPYTGKF
jgi:hypothetical protein